MQTILIIEDNLVIRDNLGEILSAEGFEVVEAVDGIEGFEIAVQYLPDLIICDVMMPNMNGLEVLSRLRQRSIDIPFIFLTARATPSDTRSGMELGAEDYITKPFERSVLLKAIATQLQKKSKRDQGVEFRIAHMQSIIHEVLPHELRTPLNGILANISLLKEMELPEEAEQLINDIQASALRQNRLTETWMGFYASETSKALGIKPLDKTEADLLTTGMQVAVELGKRYDRENDIRCTLSPIKLALPQSSLTRLLSCLVDNALKFSSAGTPVEIYGKWDYSRYQVSVYNQGVGMTAAQISQIGPYMKFWQKEGLGLGLAIVQNICEQYQGRLYIESEPGSWIRVNLILPAVDEQ